jgi:glycerol-3-phosphate dehydrogenase (NAD(P)+)
MAIKYNKLAVIGSGAWGTVLANMFRHIGRDATLWAHEQTVVDSINKTHENKEFLRGVELEQNLKATKDLAAFNMHEAIFLVAPAQHLDLIAKQLAPNVKRGAPVVICSKGIDGKTGAFLSEIVSQHLPHNPIGVMSGPTFAGEVVRGLPTAVVIAFKDEVHAREIAESIGNMRFRPYTSNDIIGVQVGGALKNVIAIAAGIVIGKNFGENARASLVTRGLAEITRFGLAMGAKQETLMGLSGMGDLMLTAGSTQSRNMSLGAALGRGDTLEKIMSQRHTVAEGVATASAALIRSGRMNVEMPITEAVHNILHKNADIVKTLEALLTRPIRSE